MDKEAVERRIKEILVEHLGVSEVDIQPSTLLVPSHDERGVKIQTATPDLGADSLDVVELVMAIEEEFYIEIPDDEAEQLNDCTVSKLFEVVHGKILEKAEI